MLKDILIRPLEKFANVRVLECYPDLNKLKYAQTAADVFIVSAVDNEADSVARELLQFAPGSSVIVITPDGRGAWIFKAENARKSLPQPTVANIIETICAIGDRQLMELDGLREDKP